MKRETIVGHGTRLSPFLSLAIVYDDGVAATVLDAVLVNRVWRVKGVREVKG